MDLNQMTQDLPEAFSMRQEDGKYTHIKDPAYQLLAPGFYGVRNAATFYDEGEMIVYDGVPNYHLQPLNKAAGERIEKWLEALPAAGASINIEDLAEATKLIASKPELQAMTPEQISEATFKIAVGLKKKRDNAAGSIMPPMGGETIFTAGQTGKKAPAMSATRYLDPSLMGPGQTGQRGVIHEPTVGPRTAKRAAEFASTPRG